MSLARYLSKLASLVGSDGKVPAAGIADGAITDAKIASGVDASKLTTGTLPIARIADGALTTAKHADASITNAKLAAGSVSSGIIADGAALKPVGDVPYGNNQNVNNFLVTGLYALVAGNYTGTTNGPPPAYGLFVVMNHGTFVTQIAFTHASGAATGYYRTKYMSGTNNEYWMPWSAF